MTITHPFTIRQLQYAVAVADLLSFRKAAARCHVSQPSLSAQLAQLEEVLGVKLFERDRRRVLPTAAGRELVERARQVLREADDLVAAASQVGDPLSGTLRVGVIATISPYLLPRLLPPIHAAFPRLTLRWVEGKTAALLAALDAGELEAALVALEADLGDVEREPVGRDPFLLATPATHPLSKRRGPATLGELRGTTVLLLDDGHCFRDQALAFCSTVKARELEFRATSLSTLAQMVAGGAGVTLLPEMAVPTEAQRARLHVRPFAAPAPFRTVALVWRRRSPLGASLRELAAVIRKAYGRVSARGRAAPPRG